MNPDFELLITQRTGEYFNKRYKWRRERIARAQAELTRVLKLCILKDMRYYNRAQITRLTSRLQ